MITNQITTLIDAYNDAVERLTSEEIYSKFTHAFKPDNIGKLRGKPPFRESNSGSSFTVYPDKGFFDAGDGFAGSPADYLHSLSVGRWEKAKGRDFVAAVKLLCDQAGVELPERQLSQEEIEKAQQWERRRTLLSHAVDFNYEILKSPDGDVARDYLASRNIDDAAINQLKIGYCHQSDDLFQHLKSKGFSDDEIKSSGVCNKKFDKYISFPWLDVTGKILTIYYRYHQKQAPEGSPKTYALHGEKTKSHPFLMNSVVANNHRECIFVEGLFDAVALKIAGETRACSGVAASFSNEQIAQLKRHRIEQVYHVGDPDAGGDAGTESNLKRLLDEGINVFIPEKLPDGLDPDEYIKRDGIDALKKRIENAEHGLSWMAKRLISKYGNSDSDKIKLINEAKAWIQARRNLDPVIVELNYFSVIAKHLGISIEAFKHNESLSNNNFDDDCNHDNKKLSSKQRVKNTEDEIREAMEKVETILLDHNLDDISKEIKINQIKENLEIDWKLWDKLRSKINKKIRGNQLELELKSINLIDDEIKKPQAIHDLSEKYRMSIYTINQMLKGLKARNTTPEFESLGLDELFDEVSDAIDYLIPGLLPKGESAVLAASPKVGKSLLAVDLAFAVATGEDYFLGEKTQTGKVLYVSVDESKQSVKSKLIKRGFRKSDASNIKIITQFCISQLPKLEAEIEDFKPTLVIIDSLKRITKGLEISENSAEFADNIYTISELCNRYGASCLLIHHTNKNNESTGVENVRGSSAIAGALGNVWVLNRVPKQDPDNKKKLIFDPRDTRRQLFCYSRDSEGKSFNLEFNPENNSWAVMGEAGVSDEEALERKTNKDRILSIMRMNQPHHPEGLKGSFIFDCLELEQPGGMPKSSMYIELNRLVSAKIIGSKPIEDSRGSLYFLHGYGQSHPKNTTKQQPSEPTPPPSDNSKNGNIPPLPPLCVSKSNPKSETITDKEFEVGYIENNFGYKSVTSNSCNQVDVTNGKAHHEGVSADEPELVTSLVTQGGGGCALENVTKNLEAVTRTTNLVDTTNFGERPQPTQPINNERSSTSEPTSPTQPAPQPQPKGKLQPQPAPQPVIGKIYLDAEGYPHRIIKKDEKGWHDQNGEIITPGIFKNYKNWSKDEGDKLVKALDDAATQLKAGDATAIDRLRYNPIIKAQINMARSTIKKQIGVAKWQLIQDYLKAQFVTN